MGIFAIVIICWIFSVCLHEYGHAWMADRGGDYTVREKGYLSMNPIYYAHPVMSFVLPMLFMMLGGIGLPGGAVYIDRSLLRSKKWETYVSLAGPLMNVILALLCTLLLKLVFIPRFPDNPSTYALAFLLELQISAVLFNLVPIPPLDGFNAIEPWLPEEWSDHIAIVRQYGLFILFILFWRIDPINNAFWMLVYRIIDLLGIDGRLAWDGYEAFRHVLPSF